MLQILCVDDYDLDAARNAAASFGCEHFGYVVTPNVDHVLRYYYDAHFRTFYAGAAYVLLDSRFLALLLRLFKRQQLRVCLGSDLTAAVFSTVTKPHDVAVLVGGTIAQAETLRTRYGLTALHHIDPPMNFIHNPSQVEACLRSIEAASPFRFCFLAIGSPQQEIIAYKLKERGLARGLALCIGASINFLTGTEKRAPHWIQRLSCEWAFRLAQDPKRLVKRYFLRGPRIFWLLSRIDLQLRQQLASPKPDTLV